MKKEIETDEKQLKYIEGELKKLVKLALSGTLQRSTIQETENEFLESQRLIKKSLENNKSKLKSLPDIEEIKIEADHVRIELLRYFGSEEYVLNMTFKEKRLLLHWLFDGRDSDNNKYGIYLKGLADGKMQYFIFAKLIYGAGIISDDSIDDLSTDLVDFPNFRVPKYVSNGDEVSENKYKSNILGLDKKNGCQ
ncbi:MAG: hypothetical protein HQ552_13905 [Desulfobacteraceae bacterium]|nr:hypothetical protein [Desulfobacteraceae bacterium]